MLALMQTPKKKRPIPTKESDSNQAPHNQAKNKEVQELFDQIMKMFHYH